MIEVNKFLDKDLEHIGETLEKPPGADTVRAEAALKRCTNLSFVVNIK